MSKYVVLGFCVFLLAMALGGPAAWLAVYLLVKDVPTVMAAGAVFALAVIAMVPAILGR